MDSTPHTTPLEIPPALKQKVEKHVKRYFELRNQAALAEKQENRSRELSARGAAMGYAELVFTLLGIFSPEASKQ